MVVCKIKLGKMSAIGLRHAVCTFSSADIMFSVSSHSLLSYLFCFSLSVLIISSISVYRGVVSLIISFHLLSNLRGVVSIPKDQYLSVYLRLSIFQHFHCSLVSSVVSLNHQRLFFIFSQCSLVFPVISPSFQFIVSSIPMDQYL